MRDLKIKLRAINIIDEDGLWVTGFNISDDAEGEEVEVTITGLTPQYLLSWIAEGMSPTAKPAYLDMSK